LQANSWFIKHPYGEMDDGVSLSQFEDLYEERNEGDDEHFGVSVTHESHWSLGLYPNETLVWENLEDNKNTPRHMKDVSKEKVLGLWTKLAQGKIEEINSEFWLEGYY